MSGKLEDVGAAGLPWRRYGGKTLGIAGMGRIGYAMGSVGTPVGA